MRQKKNGKKVFVGLSGGVDSAVAAALLLEQGYDVVPVFLKCWEDVHGAWNMKQESACPWEEDQQAALAVAEHLGVADRFRSWNLSEEFFETVVRYLVDEARAGRTGNPDVVCNRTIKFGAFLERALAEGADCVATGHYARVARTYADGTRTHADSPRQSASRLRESALLRAKCEPKNDQTYFLWQLTQEQLLRCLFPIGDFESKEAVRREARRRGLPVADRKSTRGICFVSPRDGYAGFLQRFLPKREGEVVTTAGRVVGQHEGTPFYTIGQRQGIGVTADGGPYYVVDKDEKRNRLIVAPPADAHVLWRDEVVIGNVNWLSGRQPRFPLRCESFVRHPQDKTVRCTVSRETTRKLTQKNAKTISRGFASDFAEFRVKFEEPQYAPAPGQSVVLYSGETCIGGGVIQ